MKIFHYELSPAASVATESLNTIFLTQNILCLIMILKKEQQH